MAVPPIQQMIHGALLLLVGVAGYVWNPSKAISALIAGALTGGINMFLYVMANNGASWAAKASLNLNFFFLALFGWRAYGAWNGYAKGNEDKLVPAALITLMFLSTLVVLPTLLRGPAAVVKPNTTRRKVT